MTEGVAKAGIENMTECILFHTPIGINRIFSKIRVVTFRLLWKYPLIYKLLLTCVNLKKFFDIKNLLPTYVK